MLAKLQYCSLPALFLPTLSYMPGNNFVQVFRITMAVFRTALGCTERDVVPTNNELCLVAILSNVIGFVRVDQWKPSILFMCPAVVTFTNTTVKICFLLPSVMFSESYINVARKGGYWLDFFPEQIIEKGFKPVLSLQMFPAKNVFIRKNHTHKNTWNLCYGQFKWIHLYWPINHMGWFIF